VLVLQATFSQRDNNQRMLTPNRVLLFIAGAKDPDAYRLPPGRFSGRDRRRRASSVCMRRVYLSLATGHARFGPSPSP
jgi:hypothetical protein